LRNGASNGALDASITTGIEMIHAAQAIIGPLSRNVHTDALDGLGEALAEMLEQLRL
jgi:hypothetical protein